MEANEVKFALQEFTSFAEQLFLNFIENILFLYEQRNKKRSRAIWSAETWEKLSQRWRKMYWQTACEKMYSTKCNKCDFCVKKTPFEQKSVPIE